MRPLGVVHYKSHVTLRTLHNYPGVVNGNWAFGLNQERSSCSVKFVRKGVPVHEFEKIILKNRDVHRRGPPPPPRNFDPDRRREILIQTAVFGVLAVRETTAQ